MARVSSNELEGLGGSLVIYLMTLIVVAIPFAIPVFLASQPTYYPNSGMAAYMPPPATRLIPLINRKMVAPLPIAVGELEKPALNAMVAAGLKQPTKPNPEAERRFRMPREAKRDPNYVPMVHDIQPADRGSHP